MRLIIFLAIFLTSLVCICQNEIHINSYSNLAEFIIEDNLTEFLSVDEYGNIKYDSGSARFGRYEFRITDVNISKEIKEATLKGCNGPCPQRMFIYATCKFSDCVADSAHDSNYKGESATFVYQDIEFAERFYSFLVELQRFIYNQLK